MAMTATATATDSREAQDRRLWKRDMMAQSIRHPRLVEDRPSMHTTEEDAAIEDAAIEEAASRHAWDMQFNGWL